MEEDLNFPLDLTHIYYYKCFLSSEVTTSELKKLVVKHLEPPVE